MREAILSRYYQNFGDTDEITTNNGLHSVGVGM